MSTIEAQAGNANDAAYSAYLMKMSMAYSGYATSNPVFQTDADNLWQVYLDTFPDILDKQFHNCNACRHFIERWAGLVGVNTTTGQLVPLMWDPTFAPADIRPAVERLYHAVSKAKIVHPFYSELKVFGEPQTGVWTHLNAANPKVFTGKVLPKNKRETAAQRMAEKRQDYIILVQSLADFPIEAARKAVQILEASAVFRSDKFLGVAKWFLKLHEDRDKLTGSVRNNIIWLAVAQAPDGWTHVRSSMIGTLLEDIVAGLPLDQIKARFAANMVNYQRAQGAPTAGQITAAEQAVEALGIGAAFSRRYATAADLSDPYYKVWTPSVPDVVVTKGASVGKSEAGVFDHLRPQATTVPEIDIPAKKMTWDKFSRDVLPGAAVIEYRVPMVGHFCALTVAADPTAPPILQWDSAERRNSLSWSFPAPAATGQEWNLTPGTLAKVRMIVGSPNEKATHDKGAFILLEGAKDTRGRPGGGLFPEHLKGELKPFRATIEAHMNKLLVEGADDPATVGFGIGLMAGAGEFTETAAPKLVQPGGPVPVGKAPDTVHVFLVIDDSGSMGNYLGAARQAVQELLTAVQAMPGKVYLTAIKFGASATVLCSNRLVSIENLYGILNRMDASSGGTALNDTVAYAINMGLAQADSNDPNTSFFLGIVTDGEENQSRRYSIAQLRQMIQGVLATGRWTVTYAGAGRHPAQYAAQAGIPPGNVKVFEASARGFADVGASYAASTRNLAAGYRSGVKASTSFFAAATGNVPLGKDHPVFVVTAKSGAKAAYELDRWE